jgi:hypothetical protein
MLFSESDIVPWKRTFIGNTMLIIRREQRQAFREEVRRRFVERVLRRLRQHFPEKFAAVGEDAAKSITREGIDCAKTHNITIERDVFRFIALMFLFGTDFYRTQPWAKNTFDDLGIRRPSERMALLCIAAEAQIEESNQAKTRELLNV